MIPYSGSALTVILGGENKMIEEQDKDQLLDPSGETDVELFVGTNYPYYNQKWKKSREKKISWNFASFFLSMFWMGYRKMYLPVILMLALFFIIDLLFYFLNGGQITDSMVNRMDSSVTAGISVMMGLYGNYFYYMHVKKKVHAIQSEGLPEEEKNTKLRKRGQTSWLGVLFVFISFLVYAFLSAMFFPTAEDKIATLKNGVYEGFSDQTIGEALDNSITNPDWQLIENDDGEEIIRLTGTMQSYLVSMDFIIEDEYFEIVNGEINGVPMNSEEINELLYYILQTNTAD
jgi:hypothetical protein